MAAAPLAADWVCSQRVPAARTYREGYYTCLLYTSDAADE